MITIHAQLKDKQGNELDAQDTHGHTYAITVKAAMVWGRARLQRCNDPDCYVQYTFTQSKPKIMAYIGEPIIL